MWGVTVGFRHLDDVPHPLGPFLRMCLRLAPAKITCRVKLETLDVFPAAAKQKRRFVDFDK